ncbi:antibiotic biosynthesis monooxygenase family protein [Aquabacter sp. CN5-332]|uniref:antibiotic biosynthesis monooxygenase family protein n=1 Tax=Aquabacter sp. CN5-332 TaxID=3156608 RepID=UPI0032B51AEE
MVYEIAQLTIKDGEEAAFEAGAKKAVPLFQRAKGCMGMSIERSIENPQHYTLIVEWETVDDHMVHFRNSPDFQEWRGLVGGTFAAPPQVHHTQVVLDGF